MREIEERAAAGDEQAMLALDMYCYRLKKYIGMYSAVLGRVDALVFTAGVGENSDVVRSKSCEGMSALGLKLDPAKNQPRGEGVRELQMDDGPVKILVIPTNEELEIAEQTVTCLKNIR
jgi:acetate kinase